MAGVNVRRLRLDSGFEILPENPPAHVYLGDLHLLEYFARVAERADCGMLLDVAGNDTYLAQIEGDKNSIISSKCSGALA